MFDSLPAGMGHSDCYPFRNLFPASVRTRGVSLSVMSIGTMLIERVDRGHSGRGSVGIMGRVRDRRCRNSAWRSEYGHVREDGAGLMHYSDWQLLRLQVPLAQPSRTVRAGKCQLRLYGTCREEGGFFIIFVARLSAIPG